jgi:AraC-like DNA-binding protein
LIIGGYGQFNRAFVLNWWHDIENRYYIWHTLAFLFYAFYMYYYYQCWKLYKDYRKWIETEFSDTEKVSYRWFYNFIICHILVYIAIGINQIYLYTVKFGYDQMLLEYISTLFLTYYISISGYAQARVRHVLYQPQAFVQATFEGEEAEQFEDNTAQIETIPKENAVDSPILKDVKSEDLKVKNKNSLSEDDLCTWKNKLLKVFEADKPYLNPELTLSDLAEKLKTNTSILSQVINSVFNKNFNDFINEYRVEAFKEKINTPQYAHYTMLAVAFDCGFNSKATFNRAFKKLTNLMPSEFLQKK